MGTRGMSGCPWGWTGLVSVLVAFDLEVWVFHRRSLCSLSEINTHLVQDLEKPNEDLREGWATSGLTAVLRIQWSWQVSDNEPELMGPLHWRAEHKNKVTTVLAPSSPSWDTPQLGA
jgi:hypothetical protein